MQPETYNGFFADDVRTIIFLTSVHDGSFSFEQLATFILEPFVCTWRTHAQNCLFQNVHLLKYRKLYMRNCSEIATRVADIFQYRVMLKNVRRSNRFSQRLVWNNTSLPQTMEKTDCHTSHKVWKWVMVQWKYSVWCTWLSRGTHL